MARSGIRNKLGRHARLFVVVAGLALVAAPVGVLAQPTAYEAGCKIQIKAIGPGGAGGMFGDDPKKNPTESVGSFETIAQFMMGPDLASRVATDLNVPVSRVLGKINVKLIPGTQVFALTAVDKEADFAAVLCNAYGVAFLKHRVDGARHQMNVALLAQRARWKTFRADLKALDAKIRAASKTQAELYQFQRLHIASNISDVEEEIVNLEAARGLGLEGAGQVISPAGSTGVLVGPNRAFPIGLMLAGVVALAVTALIPRRRPADEVVKTY